MLYELAEDAGELQPAALEQTILDALSEIVADVGVEDVVEASGVNLAVVEALAAGDAPELSVSQAAGILAVADEYPDADAIARESLDDILLGMTTGVLDVDAVAANVDLDVSPKGVQQRIEGRTRMTLGEYAAIKQFVASQQR